MTIEDKNDLIEILSMEIKRIEDKMAAGLMSVEQKDERVAEINKFITMLENYPNSEESYKEMGRKEFSDRLIEIIKEYRDDGVKFGRLDHMEEHNCNRIKYFTERLRDTWNEPYKQLFI